MCKFFSFNTKGDGKPMYFDAAMRRKIAAGEFTYEADSHSSINDYHGLKGADEDGTNKYEYIVWKDEFVVDQSNAPVDDRENAQNWVKEFVKTKKFTEIFGLFFESGRPIDARGCDLSTFRLPESLTQIGSLDVSGCKNLTKFDTKNFSVFQ